jgi:sigma-B regulation protein RsbU (phosphoserine phosphatase)
MDATVLQRIQHGLQEKRQGLSDWLKNTPPDQKQLVSGPCCDEDIQAQIKTIDRSLGQIQDNTFGVCEVCHHYVDASVLEVDYTACVCLDHYTEQERRQLETELELSLVFQRALLPQALPAIPGLTLAAFSRPAQILGGDYFDFIQYQDGLYGLAIADAVGHGVAASMYMTSLQTALHTLSPESNSPTEVIRRINRFYIHNVHMTSFLTVFLSRYDPVAHILTYGNAGHNPPMVYRGVEGNVYWLQPTGAGLGFIEDYTIEPQTISLSVGDLIILYTDGVVEAENSQGENFGYGRLEKLVARNATLSSQELLKSLRQALSDFVEAQPLADDTTIVIGKISG